MGWEDDWSCVTVLHNTESLVLLKLLRSAEDIEASFTHMTMEEVWVVFHEVVVQSSFTVEVDINTVRTHLLLLSTLCDTVHES